MESGSDKRKMKKKKQSVQEVLFYLIQLCLSFINKCTFLELTPALSPLTHLWPFQNAITTASRGNHIKSANSNLTAAEPTEPLLCP